MLREKRADPDELLACLEKENCGKLTVFLGAAAGVGKTYAMLEAAKERLAEGVDVVVGLVETHGRADTEGMLEGMPMVPTRKMEYKGRTFAEMDLDALLARRPQLALVDELAHTNIPGSRHLKRYQDVEELLTAGINVYTSLNIQHLETLNDIVAQITEVSVRETVPDRFLEIASQIQLIDIPPEELIQRLKEGKVYVPGQAAAALKKFFRPGNINALRELALRYTAQRVDRQLESYMRVHGIAGPWPTGEKVMVCVSASPFSAQLIRYAKRMATRLQAEWLAVHVDSPRRLAGSEAERDFKAKNLHLAEQLGAETIGLSGEDIAEEIAELAKKRNVSQIIIGKPEHTRLWDLMHGSLVDQVIRRSQGISIHVIPGHQEQTGLGTTWYRAKDSSRRDKAEALSPAPFLISAAAMALLTLILHPFTAALGLVNVAMLYLLPILITAARWGMRPAIFSAVLGLITFDFLFVPPVLTFTVDDVRYLITFVIFLLVGIITGSLSTRLKKQVTYSRQRETRVSALYALSRDIAAVDKLNEVLESIARNVADSLDGQVVLLLPNEKGKLELQQSSAQDNFLTESELAVATWVFERGQKAGRGTETLGAAEGLYLPMATEQGTQGVLGIRFKTGEGQFEPERLRLLEGFVGLAAMSINRIKLTEQARQAQTLAESERLRSALFNSLSHDLRTPLASIIGAVTGLLEETQAVFSPEARRDLLKTILFGAERMNRFVNNLLDMARLESGLLKLNKDWCDIQDIVGVAIGRLGEQLASRPLSIRIQPDLPMLEADFMLIEQVLVNLLDNALKYSEPESKISISAQVRVNRMETTVSNLGQGIPQADLAKVFDKFYRLNSPLQVSGTGLGLAICKEIIELHGGKIWASNTPAGGVEITFYLPVNPIPDKVLGREEGDSAGN